jgi:ABC-type Na+ efflux pump permease subunit
MNTVPKLDESPKERLERVARSGRPFHRELRGPNYLFGAALLLLFLSMVVVAIVGGTLASDVVAEYARRIMEWAWPAGR